MVEYEDNIIKAPIVIDTGSGVIKAGLGGEEKPSLIFNTYVGRTKHERVMVNANDTERFIGQAAEKYRGLIKLTYPIEHGIVKDWDDMEAIWRHVFEELKVPKLFFHTSSVLSLYARGLTTGVVLDVGDGCSHASAIYEGFSITNATRRIDLGGRDITEHLALLLQRAGYSFRTTSEFQIVRKIKELHCYLELHNKKYDADLSSFSQHKLSKGKDSDLRTKVGSKEVDSAPNSNDYVLPDGSKITLSNADKSKAPEILFRPSLIGLEYPGIHELVYNSIKACDIDLRKPLCESIVVAGSTTMMKSFCGRLHKQIQQLFPKNSKVTLMAPANRQNSCWIGGSTISSLKAFDKMWISKREFEQEDGRILTLNCM